MLRDERIRQILVALKNGEARTTAELASIFDVSEMTLRRDLDYLDDAGMIRRVRGGAIGLEESDPGFHRRARENTPEKRRIGKEAALLPKSGATIYLDAGTTTTEVGRALAERAAKENVSFRIVTHAINIGAELAGRDGIALHMLGGEIDPGTLAAFGSGLAAEISRINFDIYFMGLSGMHPDRGLTNSSSVGIDVKQAALGRARETWVVADERKWRQISAYQIGRMSDIVGIVIDTCPDSDIAKEVERTGLICRCA